MRVFLLFSSILAFLTSCTDGNEFNLFSIEQDKQLGAQVKSYIESPESGITLVDSSKYPEAYKELYKIRNYILNSDKLQHRKDFEWRARIIKDDKTLNAFATPGGYIYVYSGLVKYLDSEDELAGILAHEVAHADQRHTTAMLTKTYGVDLLFTVIIGNDYHALREISENLLGLSFSRGAEEDADRLSVLYLCRENGEYKADGAAGFFEKLIKEDKSGQTVEFLSTHPNPPNRIGNIKSLAKEMGCDSIQTRKTSYQNFKNSLP